MCFGGGGECVGMCPPAGQSGENTTLKAGESLEKLSSQGKNLTQIESLAIETEAGKEMV